jgi:predicted nucleic acid binding AN1-type Zn finger protein
MKKQIVHIGLSVSTKYGSNGKVMSNVSLISAEVALATSKQTRGSANWDHHVVTCEIEVPDWFVAPFTGIERDVKA